MTEFPKSQAVLGGRLTDVDPYYRQAIEQLERGRAGGMGDGQRERSLAEINAARLRFQELADRHPNDPHHLDWVAECDTALSEGYAAAGQLAEAQAKADEAKALRNGSELRRWRGREPLCRAYERIKALNESAFAANVEGSLKLYQEGAAIGEQLVAAAPMCPQYRNWLSAHKGGSAKRLSELGRHAEAKADYVMSCRLRRDLVAQDWRPALLKCQLANTLYAQLRSLHADPTTLSRQKTFKRCLECCEGYCEVLRPGFGLEWLDRYLEMLALLLQLSRSPSELQQVDQAIVAAQDVIDRTKAEPEREFRLSRLVADCRQKQRQQQVGVVVARGLQWALCVSIFCLTAIFSFPLFCLVAFPCLFGLRLIGTAERRFAAGRLQNALSGGGAWLCMVVAHQHGCPSPVALLLGGGVCLLDALLASGRLRWRGSDRCWAVCARFSRRTDLVAEQWALWIADHCPPWLAALVLEDFQTECDSHLCLPFYLLACGCAVSTELLELGGELLVLVDEIVKAVLVPTPARPPSDRPPASTSWAILLRRPLHLARGDDVPLCA